MGIRVHKVVGYGLRGFEPSPEVADRLREDETTIKEFITWCEEHREEILALPTRSRSAHERRATLSLFPIALLSLKEKDGTAATMLHDCLAWDDEFGVKDALVILPPEYAKAWSNYNNFVDWAEESSRSVGGEPADRFEHLKIGLYPNSLGDIPLSVGAVLLFHGLGDLWPKLHESLYVWWS